MGDRALGRWFRCTSSRVGYAVDIGKGGGGSEYEEKFSNPYVAAERGLIDDVIEARETRPRLIRALAMLRNKRENLPPKKHGNIPL